MIEYKVKVYDDRVVWYNLEGQLHREDGPAVEYNGNKYWYKNGQRHREDGPVAIWADGSEFWFLNDKKLHEQEFLARTQTTELTLDQIAEKFGCSVDKLKIKK